MTTLHLTDLSMDELRVLLFSGNGWCVKVDPTDRRLERLDAAYADMAGRDLRYDIRTCILRDNDGWLQRPSNPADRQPDSLEDGRLALARAVWCEAVRLDNVARLGLEADESPAP